MKTFQKIYPPVCVRTGTSKQEGSRTWAYIPIYLHHFINSYNLIIIPIAYPGESPGETPGEDRQLSPFWGAKMLLDYLDSPANDDGTSGVVSQDERQTAPQRPLFLLCREGCDAHVNGWCKASPRNAFVNPVILDTCPRDPGRTGIRPYRIVEETGQ